MKDWKQSARQVVIVRFVRLVIRFYQLAVSPYLPKWCRFEPSCSRYALEALERHGPLKGSYLTIRRLIRCRPFGGCGYDPVP